MEDLMHRPGFMGTGANLLTDVALVLMALVAVIFTVGFVLARKGKYEAHRWVQTGGGVLTMVLVLWLMVLPYRDFVLSGLPERLPEPFYWVTTLHAVVGAVALPFGMFVILRGHGLVPKALQFSDYRLFMRLAYGLFMLTILIGFAVYVVWFVTNPNPPSFV